jgi:hypothetical protein
MEVAGYRLEATVGSGGQGTVFRARREGLPFAVKFISLSRAPWAWRELDVGVKLWRSAGLPLVGYGLWPALKPRFLFLVTPYVRGLPLDVWAQVHNPPALQVAELVLPQAGAEPGLEEESPAYAATEEEPRKEGTPVWTLAGLLKRTFALDVLACLRCGGRLEGVGGP